MSATITHGRHCTCSACARQDWSEPQLACCGMHGPDCPPVYAPLGAPGEHDPTAAASMDVEAELRREWWANHGHGYYALYGDDGEMQCGLCLVDFKRAPLDQVKEAVFKARMERAAEVAKETPGG